MAYLQIERTGGADGLDAIGKFASLQQGLQQGLLQQQLMQSRLQTEELERQAQQFGLDEAKANAPLNRTLKQLELQTATSKQAMQQALLTRMPAEWNQQDRAFEQNMLKGDQDLETGSIRQRAMNQALLEQKDAYETGKLAGPAYMKMLKDAGVTGLPQAAQDLFQGQIGERVAQQMLQMTQFKQQTELKNKALQVELARTLNPWKDPGETMQFIGNIGRLAKENPELLKSYRDKLADPELSTIIDGALKGAAENPDMDKVFDKSLNDALNSDDPAIRDSALNVQALLRGGQLRPQPVYDAKGNPLLRREPKPGSIPNDDGSYDDMDMQDVPVTVSATELLKKDLAKILGPKSSTSTTKPSTTPANKVNTTVNAGRSSLMQLLQTTGADVKTMTRIGNMLAQFRVTKNPLSLQRELQLLKSLPVEQQRAIQAEIEAIQAGE